jgi:hypothetical protein
MSALISIIKNVLSPLAGSVILNRREYSVELAGDIPRDYLGIGTLNTWHGTPDCRCDIDVVNVDFVGHDLVNMCMY